MSAEIVATRRQKKRQPTQEAPARRAAPASERLEGRELLSFLTGFKKGDFSVRLPTHLDGVDGKIADLLNDLVDLNGRLANELTRVARVVGEEGRITQRASLGNASGRWAASVDAVNGLISDLVYPTSETARVIGAVARGDLSQTMALEVDGRPLQGEFLRTAKTMNVMVDQLNSFASEVTRVAREVGTEGKLGGQAEVKGVAGVWKGLTENVNLMAGNLTAQVRNIADVTKAVASGDLSKKITVDVKGEILALKNTLNVMVDQLNSFASEVTRVAREVGTEGKLGGQAVVKGISGTWKDLTENVNQMAGNLTSQVRGIAKVVTAVANGDLKRKLTVEAKGEIAELADTINGMIETLAIFADQVTTVAREVGVEGQLGGQASVPGAAGTWKDLTENVNQLAQNLTTQMRAIAEVATAVTTGDLTRSIAVDARGEVASLKDNINEMIRHLRDTTQKNTDQDWLKTNLAKFSRMLQGQKDLLTVGRLILSELAPVVYAQHGVFYILDASGSEPELRLLASYAHRERKSVGNRFRLGEGLVGQAAFEKDKIVLTSVPSDYVRISSGLGEATPVNVIVLPVIFEGQVKAVLELASFERFNPTQHAFLDQLAETIGIVLNTIEANTRTEDLLKQSQSLASELQRQQEELRQTNQQLEEKAGLLAQQNVEVERKNQEIEQARQGIEEKAKQLALTSKYKSEFVANMSHELRTPLNSLLILSDQLAKNAEGNLSLKQMQFAKTIHSSGNDLLMLINDILDLAKIESGTVAVDAGEVRFTDLQGFVERTFRHVAESKKLGFSISVADDLPRSIYTDSKRVQQILKNLLSNAFKFTEWGQVELSIAPARSGWNREIESLSGAEVVIGLSVHDTGIGIPASKHGIIFEAFQQADGSTSRRYGGTGLGLAISREIAQVLGGEITLASAPGEGSTFTLFLPQSFVAPPGVTRRRAELEPQSRRVRVAEPLEAAPVAAETAPEETSSDDRIEIQPDDRVLLVVDNDESFARCVLDAAHETGWRVLLASSGSAAVALVREFEPDAITLDLRLPDIDGFRILQLLKTDLETRHIPVLVISTDDAAPRAYELGASSVLAKPIPTRETLEAALAELRGRVDRTSHEILLVSADDERAAAWAQLLGGPDVTPRRAATAKDALVFLEQGAFECAVIDAQLPDMNVDDLIATIHGGYDDSTPVLPVVRYEPEASDLQGKHPRLEAGQVRAASPEQLLDLTTLVLHRRVSMLLRPQRDLLESFEARATGLAGRTALVVDDDVRNIFALSSVLEKEGMTVLAAENGQAAIDMLRADPGVDVVLMDIMMPGMDGFETIRAMRTMPELRSLLIIAVTAKAMKTDRESAIRAGAWDYLAKPVEPSRVIALLRSWLRG